MMNTKDIQLLKDIYEHFDGIGDGAPDASYAAKQALNLMISLPASVHARIANMRDDVDAALNEVEG